LAKIDDTEWDIKWALLCRQWNCTEHKTEMQCWKPAEPPFNGKICIPLSSGHLEMWTTAWLSTTATQFTPPSTSEFWDLKASKMPGKSRGGKAASTTPEPTFPNQTSTPITNITVNLDKSILELKNSSIKSQIDNSIPVKRCVSPITEYTASQWIDSGLIDFLDYCANKYNDQEYNKYWRLLAKERLGIDLYKAATIDSAKATALAHSLSDLVDVPAGTIQRWLPDFEEWYTIIKNKRMNDIEK
jgi:hypothetical protein